MIRRGDSIHLRTTTSRVDKTPFQGQDKLDILEPISVREFRKLLPLLPPPVPEALPNRIEAYLKSKEYFMLSTKRQQDANILIGKAYRGLFAVDDVVNYLVSSRGLKKREVQQFITPYIFDGVVDWFRMIRAIYSKSRIKQQKQPLQQLIVQIQRNYRRFKQTKVQRQLSTKLSELFPTAPPVNNFQSLLYKLKRELTSSVKNLREIFQSIDKNVNGEIDIDQFKEALILLNIKLSEPQIQQIFKQFDKTNQGFFKYQQFVEFLFGTKQISSEKGYLNNLPLVLQEIKADLKKVFLTAEAFVKDINAKLSKYSYEREFTVQFLCYYFNQLLGHKYSEYQMKQVHRELYQSIEYVKGLYNHIIKKTYEKRVQLISLIAPQPRAPSLDNLISIIYYFIHKNPIKDQVFKRHHLSKALKGAASEQTSDAFFYLFKVGEYFRPFSLVQKLGITKMAAKIYTDKTKKEREEIEERLRDKFDDELMVAGRNLGYAVEYHIGYKLEATDEALLQIDPYKMYKVLPLFEQLIDCKEQTVQKLILSNLALKFRANFRILKAKNKHSKQMADYIIDTILQKIMTNPKRKKSILKKPSQPQGKKSMKGTSVLSIRPLTKVQLINSEFISDAKNLILSIIQNLPSRDISAKRLENVMKQYIYVKQTHNYRLDERRVRLGYNNVLGGVVINDDSIMKLKEQVEIISIDNSDRVMDSVICQNDVLMLSRKGELVVATVNKSNISKTIKIGLLKNQQSIPESEAIWTTRYIKLFEDKIFINMSGFSNCIFILNTSYEPVSSIRLDPYSHFINDHIQTILSKIKSQIVERFPTQPTDFFKDILARPSIDKVSFKTFISKHVPKLFPVQVEELLQFISTQASEEIYPIDMIRLIEILQLVHHTTLFPSLGDIQQSILQSIRENNATAIQLVDLLDDKKLGYIPLESMKQFLGKLPSVQDRDALDELQDYLEVQEEKVSYKSLIGFLSSPSSRTIKKSLQEDLVGVLSRLKRPHSISRSECQETIYKHLPQYTHEETQTYLDSLQWTANHHTFKKSRQTDKLTLWYPHKVIISNYYYSSNYRLLIYAIQNSNDIYISEVKQGELVILGIIKSETLFHFVEEGLSIISYRQGSIKIWNVHSLLIKQRSVFPPWTLATPSKAIPFPSLPISIDYIPVNSLLVITTPDAIRFINILTSQEIKKIIFKTRLITDSILYQQKLPTTSPLFTLLISYSTYRQHFVEYINFQELVMNIPGNQTQYKIPIKIKQNLDELGTNNLTRKNKLSVIEKTNLDYIVRTRKVSNDAIKIFFYSLLKRLYLFGKSEGLEKVYELKSYINCGVGIQVVLQMLKELYVNHSPSLQFLTKIESSAVSTIEPRYKTYDYSHSYQQCFLSKLNRSIKIQILKHLQSLDIEQFDVPTLSSAISKIQPSITPEEIQILLQKYQKPSTPVSNYFIPLVFFRNILIGNQSHHYIYRKIDKLVRKAKEERPGYYGYELFGKLEDKVSVADLGERLKDLGLKEGDIGVITDKKSYVIQGEFKEMMMKALEYSEVKEVEHHLGKRQSLSYSKIQEPVPEVQSEQQKQSEQGKEKETQKSPQDDKQKEQNEDITNRIGQQLNCLFGNRQEPIQPNINPPKKDAIEEISPIDQIYIKIATNFNLRDIQQIYQTSQIFQKQFLPRLTTIKSIDQKEKELLLTSLRRESKGEQINQRAFKEKYITISSQLKEQRLDQIMKQLLEHIVVSINFKQSNLLELLKLYWCSDEGIINFDNFSLFVLDIGFIISQLELREALTKFNLIESDMISVISIEKQLEKRQFQFKKTVLQHKQWSSEDLSVLKQVVDTKLIRSHFPHHNPNSLVLFKQFYKVLKSLVKRVVSDTALKFIANQVFEGKYQSPYSMMEFRLFKMLESQTIIPRARSQLTYQEFTELIQESNPFSRVYSYLNKIQKQLKSTLTAKTLSSIRGIGITSFNYMVDQTQTILKECSKLVPIVLEQEFLLPEYKQQHFIHSLEVPLKEIQYVCDQDIDKLGHIVNSKFEGYEDEELCKRKLLVRKLLSNLHQSDVEYKIGKFYCLEGFNPSYFLPNGAINFDWKVILTFGKKILQQINKCHEIGFCLTNMRYTHIGKNGVIQEVYYPSKITVEGRIEEQVHILDEDSDEQVYIAPQLLRKDQDTSVKIDTWSFGCLLYEFTFGKVPPKCNPNSHYTWLSQSLVNQLLTLQHQQIVEQEYPNLNGLVGSRLLVEGFRAIYKDHPELESQIEVIQQVLKIIGLCLNVNPINRPSTQQLAKYQIFQDKKQTTNQQNEQILTVTSDITKNGGVSYKYKYAVHLSELENTTSLDDQVNILTTSIPMHKIKSILINPIQEELLNWISTLDMANLSQILTKTTNLFLSTSNKLFPESPPLFSLPTLPPSIFSESIKKSKINRNIQNKWIKLLMNSEYFQCLSYLVCKSRNKILYQKYFQLMSYVVKELKKYTSAFVFYIDRVLIQILKLCFGVPIGFSEGKEKYLRQLISTTLNQEYIDEFLDPSLLALSLDFDYDLSKQFIRLYESIISDEGLPSTQYQPIYQYLITNPDKLRYFDSMGNILRLQVAFYSNVMANPKSRQLTMNRMDQIISYIPERILLPLQDSKCHLLFISVLNNSDQQIRKKGLRYFQTLLQIKPIHPIFSTQVLLLSLFGSLRKQSEKAANKVISLRIFKEIVGTESPQSKRLKGSYYNTFSEILRLGIPPKQKSLQTSTYLELKPHIDEIVSLFKESSDLTKIIGGLLGSQSILQSFN